MTSGSTFLGSTSDRISSHQRECKLSKVDDCCRYVFKSALPIARRCGDISNTASESCSRVERQNSCCNIYMTQKTDKYPEKVPNDSDVYATNSAGNLNNHAGKESYHCIWQKMQNKNVDVSNCDLKNLDLSQVDDELTDDTLNKKPSNAVDVILLSKTADTNQEKLKVPEDLRRIKSPGSLQEHKSKCEKGSPDSGACLNCTMQSNDAAGSAEAKLLGSAGCQTSRNIVEEQLASTCQTRMPSSLNVVISAGQNLENIEALPGITQFKKLRNCNASSPKEDCKNDAASKFLNPGDKAQESCGLQNDFRSICWAVNESHRAQLASEAIEKGKGYPVAEFERLLYFASPVVCPSVNIHTCQACFHGQGAPLCRHDIPNISLVNLWQWYEKHGSYGLEVKAEDHRSSKQFGTDGTDHLKFHAYFVPLLSAVQLFKYHRTHPICNDNGTLGSIEVMHSEKSKKPESSPMVDLRSIFSVLVPQPRVEGLSSLPKRNGVSDSRASSECSNIGPIFSVLVPQPRVVDSSSLPKRNGVTDSRASSECSNTGPIFSVLVPQPRVEDPSSLPKRIGVSDSRASSECSNTGPMFSVLIPQPRVEDKSSLPKRNGVSDSRSSSQCSGTDLHHPPVDSKLSDDNVELLFEYFEHDQPQSRKPLFEKIQELVAGDGPSSCGMYGDPSILQSACLPDLHPHSWFAVAWYPIYMIPNGNLRAAFLTYHSLGHYVDRVQTLYSRNSNACVVSPIVGIQSYNAQGECWFQPRHSAEHLKEVSLDSDPPSVLRDRLKTLEQTASIMSRAMRTNGKETQVNKHPDYEFFLSRRRDLT